MILTKCPNRRLSLLKSLRVKCNQSCSRLQLTRQKASPLGRTVQSERHRRPLYHHSSRLRRRLRQMEKQNKTVKVMRPPPLKPSSTRSLSRSRLRMSSGNRCSSRLERHASWLTIKSRASKVKPIKMAR